MLATVASINSANRLKAYLYKKHAVSSRVIQTPSSLTKEGCGYSLRFENEYKSIVSQCAKELRINIRSFYREDLSDNQAVYIKE